MQRFTPRIGDTFSLVGRAQRETFIPALFQGLGEGTLWREVTRLPVKHLGLDFPDPTRTASENWTAACIITGHLISALKG